MNDQKELKRAFDRGNTSEVKRLLENGLVPHNDNYNWRSNTNWNENLFKESFLSLAVVASIPSAEKKKIIKMLIQHGANINSRGVYGHAAIHRAIHGDDVELVRFLIQHGANVNTRSDPDGLAPLHIAIGKRNYKIAQLLVEKGANVNSPNLFGYTPLHYLIRRATDLNFARLLLDHGANPNTKIRRSPYFHEYGMEGWTPLHTAAAAGDTQFVRLLLERGARPNATDDRGMTPLHWAAKRGHSAVVNELLSFGVSINVRSKNGTTPIDVSKSKTIKNMIITWPQEKERRRLTAIGSLNRIKKHGTKNTIHVPNNVKFQILSKTGLFNFNNIGPTKKRKR